MNRNVVGLLVSLILLAVTTVHLTNRTVVAQADEWSAKVDPLVLKTAAAGETTEFLLFLEAQADLSDASGLGGKEAKGRYVYEQLTAAAAQTQPPVIAHLETLAVTYKPFWVANMIWVRGDAQAIQVLAQRSDVAHLYANPRVPLDLTQPQPSQAELIAAALAVEWNINLVNAPAVWAAGYTGQGVVIGGQDTGYEWTHPALINQYRGWNGVTADHNYNWHDAIHSGNGGICGLSSPVPCDDHWHGTHTMGTMVGDDGGTNQIGMAPGAQWIGCRNMDVGDGTPATYAECYQWFIAPTDLDGLNPDPTKAPHVINNSWGCPPSEGCTDPHVLLTVVQNVRAAGIVTVHAAGNSGSACNTVNTPAAIYAESFTVGATTASDLIAGFSSRGVVTADGSNRRKPDVVAPGSGVRSSVPGSGYSSASGTSMAAPHVAGQTALILSAAPHLTGDVDALEELVEQTAEPKMTSQGCGGDGPSDVPNNVYGWGRIDALAAYRALSSLALSKSAAAAVTPGDTLTYTLRITNTHTVSATGALTLTDALPAGVTFVSATLPYSLTNGIVTWQIGSLPAGATETVALVVAVPLTATGTIVNGNYYVEAEGTTLVVYGPPVVTAVVPEPLYVYLPFIVTIHSPEVEPVETGPAFDRLRQRP